MLIAYRTDASSRIGTGHLIRCLALADTLAAHGARCVFLCRGAGLGPLAERVKAAGHDLVALPGAGTPDTVGSGSWQADARASAAALAAFPKPDWLVADHYGLDARWERQMRAVAGRIMVIDDLADRDHDCDLLLDQNLASEHAERYAGRVPEAAAQLLGPRYALLRPEFATMRASALARPTAVQARQVLVMFGGGDEQDLTGASVRMLTDAGYAGQLDVVAGPLYQPLEALRALLAALPGAKLHVQATNVAALMARADLAIGASGVTSWERCALGLPTVAIAVADNQEPVAQALAAAGVHWYVGREGHIRSEYMRAIVLHALGDGNARAAMRRAAREICDGLGTQRVARRLLPAPTVSFRFVRTEDAPLLYRWRNDERVRRHAFDPSVLSLDTHLDWVRRVLADPQRTLLLALEGDAPVGCVRLDREGDDAEVSIYLDPARVGIGLGPAVLRAAAGWAGSNLRGLKQLTAAIRKDNPASLAAFAAAGFEPSHSVVRLALDRRSSAPSAGESR